MLTNYLFDFSKELFPIHSNLSVRSSKDFRFASTLLSHKYAQHPFKHLLLEFYLTVKERNSRKITNTVEVCKSEIDRETECRELLTSGLSMAAVSREIDKSRCYVKSIALKLGINVELKPKTITQSLKNSVKELGRRGFHRNEIARRLSISTGSLEMLISATSGLVQWRKKCKHDSKRRRYQVQILRYFQDHPQAIRRDIKSDCNAAFFWLYRHEREWLERKLPKATRQSQYPK